MSYVYTFQLIGPISYLGACYIRRKVTKCIHDKIRRTFVSESLNHNHQGTKSARLIAVCKRSFTLYLHDCRNNLTHAQYLRSGVPKTNLSDFFFCHQPLSTTPRPHIHLPFYFINNAFLLPLLCSNPKTSLRCKDPASIPSRARCPWRRRRKPDSNADTGGESVSRWPCH